MKKQRKIEKDNRGVAIYARKSRITNKGDSIGVQFKQCADYAKKELGLDEDYEFLQYEDNDFFRRLRPEEVRNAKNHIGVWLNGKKQYIEVRPEMQKALESLDPKDVHAYAKELLEKDKANGKLKNVTGTQHRVSHILIKTTPVLNDAQAKAKLAQIIADIKAGKTTFEEAAKANSVDYLSAADGGDLGYNFLDIYDPAFAKAASTAKQDQITAPFKSQFGWHILKVTGTQQGDRTEDAYNQRAYEQLVDKQAQEAAKDWVKALRKTADVQYVGK